MAKKQTSINDFKNRMESPFVGVRIDPKTGKTIKKKSASGKKGK